MTSDADAYSMPSQMQQDPGTVGCLTCNRSCLYVPSGAQEVIKKLHSDMPKIHTDSLRRQVEAFCSCLSSALANYRIESPLPVFFQSSEDDEFYLEWIFDYYRFGFDFYDDERDSAWFVVMKQANGTFRFNSHFDGDYRKAIDYALSVIGKDL